MAISVLDYSIAAKAAPTMNDGELFDCVGGALGPNLCSKLIERNKDDHQF